MGYPVLDFPGYQAGASLKQAGGAQSRKHGVQLPRLPSRGLIEADHCDGQYDADGAELPRLPSRGLIEAGLSWCLVRLTQNNFPGYQAGASLKLTQEMTEHREAAYFPGYQAGASLKRERGSRWDSPPTYFPGYQAGASLKPFLLWPG